MEKLKLGAQFYTLRDFTKTPSDFYRTMRRVADIGYKYVQISGVGPEVKADVIKKSCDETGLSVYITHTPLDRIINDTERVIEEHEMFGCNIIGVGSAGLLQVLRRLRTSCGGYSTRCRKDQEGRKTLQLP